MRTGPPSNLEREDDPAAFATRSPMPISGFVLAGGDATPRVTRRASALIITDSGME
jgi:hypothetical protein